MFSQNKVGSRLLRWKLLLAEYDFDIIHRKGSQNVVSDCLSRIENEPTEMRYFQCVKNTATKSILQVITRSRTKENELLNQNKNNETTTFHINEEPSVMFDTKKYEKMYFIIDDCKCMQFKKLQLHIKKRVHIDDKAFYAIQAINDQIGIIVIPKFNFKQERIDDTISELHNDTRCMHVDRMAINLAISTYKASI